MKLTPLDIHHKEFHHALRGYSEEEVDSFLDEVADEFERLFKENIDLAEKIEAVNSKLRDYQSMEVTLNNTLVSAQRSAEQIVAQSNEEASTILRDAEVKAKEIIHSALTDKQKVQSELVRIKQAEEDFRARFRALLEQHLAGISEVTLPQDVTVLIGKTESGVVSDVDVHLDAINIAPPPPAAAAPVTFAPEPEATYVPEPEPEVIYVPEPEAVFTPAADEPVQYIPEPVEEAVVEPEPAVPVAPEAAVFGAGAEPMEPVAPVSTVIEDEPSTEFFLEVPQEPVSAGGDFVTGMQFGELDTPDLALDDPLGEPREFTMPSFDALGERDDDLDIEEID